MCVRRIAAAIFGSASLFYTQVQGELGHVAL
jgi:hypothetical protein